MKNAKNSVSLTIYRSRGNLIPLRPQIFKLTLFFVFLTILLTALALDILAIAPFEDNFNSYISNQTLIGQGGWETKIGNPISFIVESTTTKEGLNAVYFSGGEYGGIQKIGSLIADGGVSFWTRQDQNTSCSFELWENASSFVQWIYWVYTGGTYKLAYYPATLKDNLDLETWYKVTIEWRSSDKKLRFRFGNEEFTDWTAPITTWNLGINTIVLTCGIYDANVYWDLIQNYPVGSSVVFAPTTPQDCVFTTTTGPVIFNALGLVYIPDNNLNTYTQFDVIAQNWGTSSVTEYFSTSTSLSAGDIYSYNIPVALDSGAWRVRYRLIGYNLDFEPVVELHYCQGTGVGQLPLPQFITIPSYEIPATEDCSTYPLLERLVCEIRNTIKSIFLPSTEKITQLKDTFEIFKTKMPLNYVLATQSFFSNVRTGLNSEEELVVGILGTTSTIDFSFWETKAQVFGDSSKSFSTILKNVFSVIVILGFLVWGLNFGRKIFK